MADVYNDDIEDDNSDYVEEAEGDEDDSDLGEEEEDDAGTEQTTQKPAEGLFAIDFLYLFYCVERIAVGEMHEGIDLLFKVISHIEHCAHDIL